MNTSFAASDSETPNSNPPGMMLPAMWSLAAGIAQRTRKSGRERYDQEIFGHWKCRYEQSSTAGKLSNSSFRLVAYKADCPFEAPGCFCGSRRTQGVLTVHTHCLCALPPRPADLLPVAKFASRLELRLFLTAESWRANTRFISRGKVAWSGVECTGKSAMGIEYGIKGRQDAGNSPPASGNDERTCFRTWQRSGNVDLRGCG